MNVESIFCFYSPSLLCIPLIYLLPQSCIKVQTDLCIVREPGSIDKEGFWCAETKITEQKGWWFPEHMESSKKGSLAHKLSHTYIGSPAKGGTGCLSCSTRPGLFMSDLAAQGATSLNTPQPTCSALTMSNQGVIMFVWALFGKGQQLSSVLFLARAWSFMEVLPLH